MLDISLMMILAALWSAPGGTSQADFKIDFSGDNHRAVTCQGQMHIDKRPGAEAMRFRQRCSGAGPQDENREVILRFDQHKTYQLNHALKTYDTDTLSDYTELMKEFFKASDATQSRDFIDGTRLWLQPTKLDFWLMGVQEPAQQGRMSEIHLISPGYGSHMYLSYAAEPAKDTYEPPKDYRQQ